MHQSHYHIQVWNATASYIKLKKNIHGALWLADAVMLQMISDAPVMLNWSVMLQPQFYWQIATSGGENATYLKILQNSSIVFPFSEITKCFQNPWSTDNAVCTEKNLGKHFTSRTSFEITFDSLVPEIFHGSIVRRVNLKAGGVVLKWPAKWEIGRSLAPKRWWPVQKSLKVDSRNYGRSINDEQGLI